MEFRQMLNCLRVPGPEEAWVLVTEQTGQGGIPWNFKGGSVGSAKEHLIPCVSI
jgi:hypothetical protein